jgi:hypothetical protein
VGELTARFVVLMTPEEDRVCLGLCKHGSIYAARSANHAWMPRGCVPEDHKNTEVRAMGAQCSSLCFPRVVYRSSNTLSVSR